MHYHTFILCGTGHLFYLGFYIYFAPHCNTYFIELRAVQVLVSLCFFWLFSLSSLLVSTERTFWLNVCRQEMEIRSPHWSVLFFVSEVETSERLVLGWVESYCVTVGLVCATWVGLSKLGISFDLKMQRNHNSAKTTRVLLLFLIVAACQLMVHQAAAGVDVLPLYWSLLADCTLDQVTGLFNGKSGSRRVPVF